MKKNLRRLITVLLCMMLIVCSSVPALAANNNKKNNNGNSSCFKDVKEDHWAYKYILWMKNRDIIHGIGNDLFNPNGTVTRAEFAKMMVRTLELDLYSPAKPTFDDVGKKNWEYPYVESAKNYLTYYKTSTGNYFRSLQPSVREDMAVALVKALGYQDEEVDLDLLDQFADEDEITPSLRKYVALAVEYGLMKGYPKDGKLYFGPMGNLTRAEAATLLYRAFVVKEEKLPFDESKLPYEEDEEIDEVYVKPIVTVITYNDMLEVNWNKIDSPKFEGYKVVISKDDSTPEYPENGYLYYITDKDQTSAIIDNSTPYKGKSDFGEYLKNGEKYYISVTAVYSDKKITGKAVRKVYTGPDYVDSSKVPVVSLSNKNGIPVLSWNKTKAEDFKEYRVVISKDNPNPGIDDGYLYIIKDRNTTSVEINNTQKYTDGDFGKYLTKGEKYYFTVVAVYKDGAVAGKAIRKAYEGNNYIDSSKVPVVSLSSESGVQVLSWNKIKAEDLKEYRVVISKQNATPGINDGYLYKIKDRNTTTAEINNTQKYTNGDFGNYLTKGERYYITVVAVYEDGSVAGNAIRFKYTGAENPEIYQETVVSAVYEDGNLMIKWNKIDSPLLVEYRLVISKDNATPAYPEDGYYYKAFSPDTTSVIIDPSKAYKNGDFSKLEYGKDYYFSVTAVYENNHYVAGNAVKVLYLFPTED